MKEQATLPFDDPAQFRSFNMAPYTDLDVEIDHEVVNTSNQREFVEGLTSIPTLSIVMDADHLFNESHGLYYTKIGYARYDERDRMIRSNGGYNKGPLIRPAYSQFEYVNTK